MNMEARDLFEGTPAGPTADIRRPTSDVRRPAGPLPTRLRASARPDMIRVAPDVHAWIPADKTSEPPNFCLCRWTKRSDGAYHPVPFATRLVRVTGELMACLGFTDGTRRRRYETLMRLYRAGFVELVHASPGTWMLDLDSWYRHLAVCAENPDMWEEDSEDLKTYLQSNALGGWRRRE